MGLVQGLEDSALYIIAVLLLSALQLSVIIWEQGGNNFFFQFVCSSQERSVHREWVLFVLTWGLWAELIWWWTFSSPRIIWMGDHLGILGIADTGQEIATGYLAMHHEWDSDLLLSWGIKMNFVRLTRCSKNIKMVWKCAAIPYPINGASRKGFSHSCLLVADIWMHLNKSFLTSVVSFSLTRKCRWCTFEKFSKLCKY